MNDWDDIIAHSQLGTLPELFVERIRRHGQGKLDRSFCATMTELHNDGIIDVLEPARSITSSPIDQHQFFTVMQVYTDLIPDLEAEVPAMLAAVKGLTGRAGNDLLSSMPNNAFRIWSEQGDRARSVLAAIDPADPEDGAYLYLALQALAKSDSSDALTRTIAYLEGPDDPARPAAAKVIGTLALITPEARSKAAAALAAAAPAADDNSLGHILTAICEIARAHPEMTSQAVTLIDTYKTQVGDQAIHQLSLELMFHGEELAPEIMASLIAIMHKVPIGNQATINNIDSAISKLVCHKRLDKALELVTPLIAAHEEFTSMATLDGTSYALLQLPADQLAQVMIDWLLSFDRNLGAATLALVGKHHDDTPLVVEVDGTTLNLDDANRIVLAHRTIGWLFIKPITAASLLLGLLKGASEPTTRTICDILFDPLLISYSGKLAEWLTERGRTAAASERVVINELLARLDTYIEGLRKAGRIKELRPSERERLIERHRQNQSFRESHRVAEKKSFIRSIASRSVLLYGNRSISYYEDLDGKKQRHEMKLHSFSHTIEAPRLNAYEPVALDYTLRIFRTMRKLAL